MDRELWSRSYRELREVADDFRQKNVQIPGWVLAAASHRAALHDRPAAWPCDTRKTLCGMRTGIGEEVRQRDGVRGRPGDAARLGAPGPHLGAETSSSSTPPTS